MSEEKKEVKKEKSGMPLSVRFAILVIFITSLLFLPSTIVFVVCMLPTLVATIVDNHSQKTAWLTVGAMNFAGTIPVLCNLWDLGHTVPAALEMITEPAAVMIAYGGAAMGWIIYNYVTLFIAAIILNKNERRLKEIDRRQKDLVKKWGGEVTSG